jgi:hypothetical protein
MVAGRNVYVDISLMEITNEPDEIEVWNLVQR